MRDADYIDLADGVPFVIPVNPGHIPDIPDGADAVMRVELTH
jgi:hypothetical protein